MAAPGDVSPFLPSALGGSEEVGAADRKTSLAAAGLDEYLAAMTASGWSEAESIRGFRYSWMQSVLDHVSISDAVVGSFASDRHDRAIDDFMEGDRQHIADTATRIRRLVAEHAVEARNEHPEQESLVAHQARLKRRHLPVRDVIGNAADVLLALKPCWAMSPLVVSQLLPPNTYFDVVIFDEASQITPADAISTILRGTQLVIAGDDKQLPPTAFFASDNADDDANHDVGETPGSSTPAGSDADVPASVRIDARTGPMHGVQQNAKATPSATGPPRLRAFSWSVSARRPPNEPDQPMPSIARPNTTISPPATRSSQTRFSSRSAPSADALAPSARKTARKPAKNRPLATKTCRPRPPRRCENSSKLTPLTIDR